MKKFSRSILIITLILVLFVPTLLLLAGCPAVYEFDGIYFTIYDDHAAVNYFICKEGDTMVCEVPSEVEYEGNIYPVTVVEPRGYSSYGRFVEGGYASEIILPATITDFKVYEYDDYYAYSNYEFAYLEKITVHPDNEVYSDIDGVLFDADGEELLYYPLGRQDETYTIPQSMQTLNPYARLWRNKALKNIEVDADNPYFTSVDNVLYSKNGSELIFRPANDDVAYFAIPDTVSVVSYNSLPGVEYLYVPKSVTLFLESFVDAELSIKKIDYICFEGDELPNYLSQEGFRGQLYFGKTLEEFEAAVQAQQ